MSTGSSIGVDFRAGFDCPAVVAGFLFVAGNLPPSDD